MSPRHWDEPLSVGSVFACPYSIFLAQELGKYPKITHRQKRPKKHKGQCPEGPSSHQGENLERKK
jgi:hypothetical protein